MGTMMILLNILSVLFSLDKVVLSTASHSALSGLGTHSWRAPMDCLRASEMCNQNSQCSSRFRIMRQCLVGRDRTTMLANRECQAALEVLQDSPLYDCRCKRGMKRELQCLQSYWSIHMGLNEGEELYETSPYEPMHLSDEFRLASIISAMDSASVKGNLCLDTGKPCNPCLDAAKACNLNDTCKRQRSMYMATCSRATPIQQAQEPCNRKRCHKALRQFFDRVQTEFSYPLLFCSCRDKACAERRRQTIMPACSFEERTKPNCLELRRTCRSDPLCRSRLADFHMNCQMTTHSITSCPNDNYHGCLVSYVGLIGSDVTPNYVDSSHTNITISPWCGCRGSGNHEAECEAFLRDFRENPCLKNAIQAFGYGTDAGLVPITESQSAVPSVRTNLQPAIINKHVISSNDVKPIDSACVFSTCANLQDSEEKCSPSSSFECADENVLNPNMEGSIDSIGSHQTDNNRARHSAVTSISVSVATLTIACALVNQLQ
ncbi:GDNF family receptor alpha-2 [Triplophysa rosa]|uniref:GDNF family receptor alpha n=1 Tax=Triplophysa rosa TaxID=992332 RepID=A0A9W7TAA1_TRIRA|nr:GDNF family receptor alpha-2 [Triplophysa rosa]KAI7793334.1 putative GDNF family receptor alpha-2 [Triplophysa rosa]